MSHASRRRAPALIPTLLPPEGGEELNHGGGNVFPLCFQSRVGVRVAHCIEDGCFSENRCFLALTLPLTRVPPSPAMRARARAGTQNRFSTTC